MTSPAGILLALSMIIGAVVGIMFEQPSAGLLIGLAVGILLAILSTRFSSGDGPPR